MGQEFCNGCQDCTNFKDFENNFSYFGNQPIKHLNNPSYENGNFDNSIFNIKTEYPNDTSELSNNNLNGNNQKGDATQNFSFSSKQASNDLNFNPDINKNNNQTENEKFDNNLVFKNNKESTKYKLTESNLKYNNYNFINNNIDTKYKSETSDNFKDFNNNREYNNIDIESKYYTLDENEKKRLENIILNNNSKKITRLFKKLMEKKSISHQILCTEYASINDYQELKNNLSIDLTVNLIPEKNYIYVGTKFNNKKDGLGLELFSNSNAKFFGRFINGRRVSIGRFIIDNENDSYYYFGYIKGIHAEGGFGWYENAKKSIYYEGMWSNSKKEGFGIERNNKDNSEYRGYFKDGKKNGIGYYNWSDNSNYIGEWENDNLDGYGIYTFQDGSIYKGHWKKNKMDGLGEFTFPEIKSYFGFFESDKRSGFGFMIWYKESKVFLGYWNENKQHGPGKIINNGKIKYGIWENGSYKEKIKSKDIFINKIKSEKQDFLNYFLLDDYKDILQKVLNILNA